MTTDNAKNVVKASNMLVESEESQVVNHVGCFAHTLNLCTQASLRVFYIHIPLQSYN